MSEPGTLMVSERATFIPGSAKLYRPSIKCKFLALVQTHVTSGPYSGITSRSVHPNVWLIDQPSFQLVQQTQTCLQYKNVANCKIISLEIHFQERCNQIESPASRGVLQ